MWTQDLEPRRPVAKLLRIRSAVSRRASVVLKDHCLWIASRLARRLGKFILINCGETSTTSILISCGHWPLTSGAFRRQASYLPICAHLLFFQIYVFIFNNEIPADERPMLEACGRKTWNRDGRIQNYCASLLLFQGIYLSKRKISIFGQPCGEQVIPAFSF